MARLRGVSGKRLNRGLGGLANGCARSLLALAAILLGLVNPHVNAQPSESVVLEFGSKQSRELRLSIGRSQIIHSNRPLEQVVIGAPDVADIKLLNSRQVLILGIKPGLTNLVFRDKNNSLIALMDVTVSYDLTGLKRKIHDVLPVEGSVEVRGSNDSVILSGSVTSSIALETVLELTRSFVPADKIVNTMAVGGGHQVMLDVQVAEINRQNLREFGIGVNIEDGDTNGWGFSSVPGISSPFGTVDFTQGPNKYFNSFTAQLKAMEQKGLAKLLAEPNLVALSGQEASFLAGGEFPIPVPDGDGDVTLEFKEFGVGIKFKPTVLSEQKINLKVKSEVSAVDNTNSISLNNIIAPAFVTRRADTTVEMADGQSFAIAGLLQDDANNLINQFPILGDVPILGALFRSTDYQRKESELLIVITTRLVKPVAAGTIKNLTDSFVPPSALDQYLLGRLQGGPLFRRFSNRSEHESAAEEQAAIDGLFGHQLAGVN